jgi:glycosyltransferase involved in cell wall biosynthesis
LAEAIECFVRQDYPAELRELIVLDDASQYGHQRGDGWRVVSLPLRFRTLGEKRNASAALVSPDVDAYCVWDDDDIYLPWHMSAAAAALAEADYTIPTVIYNDTPARCSRRSLSATASPTGFCCPTSNRITKK